MCRMCLIRTHPKGRYGGSTKLDSHHGQNNCSMPAPAPPVDNVAVRNTASMLFGYSAGICRLMGVHVSFLRLPCLQTPRALLTWSSPDLRGGWRPAQRLRDGIAECRAGCRPVCSAWRRYSVGRRVCKDACRYALLLMTAMREPIRLHGDVALAKRRADTLTLRLCQDSCLIALWHCGHAVGPACVLRSYNGDD